MLGRWSSSKVTDRAPSHEELLPLVEAAGQVADHAGLKPWRLIEIRGEARTTLGRALAEASEAEGEAAEKFVAKAHRAALLIAVVAVHTPSFKVPDWEQDAVAAGVGHLLSLVLHEAGYGTMWRTGPQTRSEAVHRAHRLAANEVLLGWIYVGVPMERGREQRRNRIDPEHHLSSL
jgi:nitroreductase